MAQDRRQTDLTQGSVALGLIRFSVPAILAGLLQALYGMMDMVIAGKFAGDNALSGITNGGQLMTILTFLAMGLSFGSNAVIAQRYGGGDASGRKRAGETTIVLNLAAGLALTLVLCAAAGPVIRLLRAPAYHEAVAYFRICTLGLIPIFLYNGLSSMIRALGNSRMPLLFVAAAAAANVGLDLLLVAGFKMGVAGAAIATVAAQFASCAAALAYVLKNQDLFLIRLRALAPSGKDCALILRIGIPSALQFFVNGLSFTVLNRLMNQYGVDASAAYGISDKLRTLCVLFANSTMGTCSAMTAQCLGAGKPERAKRVVYTTCLFDLGMTLILLLFFEPLAPQLCALFTKVPDTAALAAGMLRIELIGMIGFCFFTPVAGLATGSGHTGFVFLNGFLFICLGQIVSGILLNRWLGAAGINWSFVFGHFAPIPHCLWFLFSNRWTRSPIQAAGR